jgi:hypothetical protein
VLFDQCSNHWLAQCANLIVAAPPQQRSFQTLIRTRRGPLSQSEEKPFRLRSRQIRGDQTLKFHTVRLRIREVFGGVFQRRRQSLLHFRWRLYVRG